MWSLAIRSLRCLPFVNFQRLVLVEFDGALDLRRFLALSDGSYLDFRLANDGIPWLRIALPLILNLSLIWRIFVENIIDSIKLSLQRLFKLLLYLLLVRLGGQLILAMQISLARRHFLESFRS